MKLFRHTAIAVSVLILMRTSLAFAHRDDFIDETLVYVTLEKGEIEPEYWLDAGYKNNERPEAEEGETPTYFDRRMWFLRHNFALEYGITDYWMIDSRGTIKNMEDKKTVFDSARFETRCRFFDEGSKPIDIALSAEVNTERDEQGQQQPALEPRLILSKDFRELNLTCNLPEKIFLRSGKSAFVPSLGFRYNTKKILRFGSELRLDTESRDDAVIPQIWFAFPGEATLKLGYSFGFARNEENFFRAAIEIGF